MLLKSMLSLSLALSFTAVASVPKVSLGSDRMVREQKEVLHAKPYDLTFIDELTGHHKEGVMMAEMAVTKAAHPELRKMAKMMAEAQAKEIAMMEDWRKDWFPRAEEHDDHSVGMRMEKLEVLTGEEFDLAFLDSMISHHPGAIYLGKESQTRGHHRKLINLGKQVEDAQIKELNQLRKWRHHWFGDKL